MLASTIQTDTTFYINEVKGYNGHRDILHYFSLKNVFL